MIFEMSAGGVVIKDHCILILKKKNGAWVLPKGRIEENETKTFAAQREVFEESGIHAECQSYLGFSKYTFNSSKDVISKTVYYYLMKPTASLDLKAQEEEGFIKASFIKAEKALKLLVHNSEKKMALRAYEIYNGGLECHSRSVVKRK